MKYYAVAVGRKIGIFTSWEETKTYVLGFPKAKYKSFTTLLEAEKYLQEIKVKDLQEIESQIDEKKYLDVEEMFNNVTTEDKLIIYTDGSCVNKIGGFGYVYIYRDQLVGQSKGKVGDDTTNQVAELYAILKSLEDCPFNNIDLYTDSKYSIGCCTIWYKRWLTDGWRNSKGEPVANKELIQEILEVLKDKNVNFFHVFGHTRK